MRLRARMKAVFAGTSRSAGPALVPRAATLARPEGVRDYLVAVPPAPSSARRALVVVLHGAGASARQVLGQAFPPSPLSVFLEIAARDDVVVIAPDAGKGGWSDCFASPERAAAKDDVAFVAALIDHAVAAHGVDPGRVYVAGVSRGGWMTYRLMAAMPYRLAACVSVLAGMPPPDHPGLPTVPLPLLVAGCTADPMIPYHGGKHRYAPPFVPVVRGIEDTARFWRELAGLPDTPVRTAIPPADPRGRTRATRYVWGGRVDGMQVALLRIDGAGHAEPSRLKRYPGLFRAFPGRQNGDLEMAEEAWDFLRDKRARHGSSPLDRNNLF